MITGTSYFVSFAKALEYYSDYGCTADDIHWKLHEHEIHIGKPEVKAGQKLLVIDNGSRYAIKEVNSNDQK